MLSVTGSYALSVPTTTLSAAVAANALALPVAETTGFSVGDEVLLVATQCDVGSLGQTGRTSWGDAPKRIASMAAGELTLDTQVGDAYDGTACTVVVQKVPNYTTVTVHDGGQLTAPAWNGTTGGILALRAQASVLVLAGGEIRMTGRGLRGSGYTCIKYDHGLQGEGYARVSPARVNAALYNGGGGGTGSKPGTPGHDCAGGGGGGHGAKGAKGGDYSGRPGGPGGQAVGDAPLSGIFLGGAGGQGGADEDGGTPGGGGHGGGIVLIASKSIISQGALRSNGNTGQSGCNGCGCGGSGCGMGGGGGGGGGTIHLSAPTVDIANGVATASGGNGGGTNGCGAGGGKGAVGRVRIDGLSPLGGSTPVAFGGSIQSFDWASATPITSGMPTPGAPGAAEAMTAGGFDASTSYYFALRSTNAVGLVSNTSNVAIRDAEPPSITITAPTDGATVTRPVVVTTTVSDDVGAEQVEFSVDGALAHTDTASPFTFDWAPAADGTYVLSAKVTDSGGQTASDSATVTFAYEAPPAPTITAPVDGHIVSTATTVVAGTSEAGTTVALTVNGTLLAETIVAAKASIVSLEAEALQNKLTGCAVTTDGSAVEVSDTAADGTLDLALSSAAAKANGSSRPSHGIDGITDDNNNYWYRTAAQNETLYYLGRVTLGQVEVIDAIHLHLWDGDARSYYNYRVRVSSDGTTFTNWVDQTGSGENYQGNQVLTGPPTPVLLIDVWLSGSTTNDGAHVKELKAFRSEDARVCVVESSLLAVPGAQLVTDFQAPGAAGDGTVAHQVQNADLVFEDTFSALDPAVWLSQDVQETEAGVVIKGTGNWGTGYLATKRTFDRSVINRTETRITTSGGLSMWGLKRPGTNYSYTTLAYAIYLNNNKLYVYEDGANRGHKATITYGTTYDYRIELTTSGAVYSYKAVGAPTWTTLYSSSYFGGNWWQAAWSHHSGSMTIGLQRVRGSAWYDVADIATLAPYAGALRFRSVLSRPDATSASPTVDRWQVRAGDGSLGVAGLGLFSFPAVDLVEGTNTLVAQASDTHGTSPVSSTVTVIVDTGPPEAITDLSATGLAAGVILLGWSEPTDEVPASYTIYRSSSEITSIDGMVALVEGVTETSFGDLPPSTGVWHYVVVSVDAVGNVSAVSNDASATSDATTPHAVIDIEPLSPVSDGTIDVNLVASKNLAGTPSLTLTLPGAADPIDVTLAPVPEAPLTEFDGVFVIPEGTPSGTATFAWAGEDPNGNVGTAIDSGGTFVVDADGPIATITFDPPSPLVVGDTTITVTLNEAAPTAPTLSITPNGGAAIPITLTGSDATWTGTFTVTGDTGEGTATLAYSSEDALENVGTTIAAGGTVEIDALPPEAPTSLVAVKHPAGYFDFSWTAPAGAGLTYSLYRHNQAGMTKATATQIATGIAGTETQSQPPAEGTWYYAVTAIDGSGKESALSNIVSVVADPPPPEDVGDLTLVIATETTLELTWTGSANSSGLLDGYRVYLDGAMVTSLPKTATGFTFEGLTKATGYGLKVSTFDTNNKESIGVPKTGWTLMDHPTALVALGKDERIELSWTAATGAGALQHYAVYISDTPFSDVAGIEPVLANPGGTSATINDLVNGETKYVAVTSVNKSGFQKTAVVAKSATPGDNEGPEAPASVTVVGVTKTTLDIEWTASANSAGDLDGYRIEVDGAQVATVAASATTYTIESLQAAKAYAISVVGFDAIPNDGPPGQVTGYTLMPHPTNLVATGHDTSLSVGFDPPSPLANVQELRVYVLPASFTSVTGLTPAKTVAANATSASVGGLTNGTTYFVAVTTVNKSGAEDPAVTAKSATPLDDAAPPPPKNLKVASVGEDTLGLTWTASTNPDGDLAGYRLYQDGTLVQTLAATDTATTVTGLAPSTKYALRLDAYDDKANQGLGPQIAGYTLMDHPSNVAVSEALHQKLVIGFDPPTPLTNVQHYAVYVGATDFTSVDGLTPTKLVSGSLSQVTVTGLVNGTPYYVAVTTVNKSFGERKTVTAIAGTPVEDIVGPSLSAVTYGGAALADGGIVEVDANFGVTGSDPVGMSHVIFLVDGTTIALDQTPGDGFKAPFVVEDWADGLHTLTMLGYDSLGNEAKLEQTFTAKLAPPAGPVLTAPANGSATNQDKILVKGTAKANTTATIYLNGAAVGTQTVDGAGGFSYLASLSVVGTNVIEATATNTGGEGPTSAPVSIIYDNTVPTPPKNLTATAKEGGSVALVWFNQGDNPLSGVAENRVYRHNAPFDDVSVATLLNGGKLTPSLSWTDLPSSDGTWYYRATVLNKAGTESLPSNQASAGADATPPKALEVTYTPKGAFLDGVFGVGPVDVTITFSEPLLTTPFFSLATDGGLPLTTSLSKVSDTVYAGQLTITASSKSGTALGVLSARDLVNNKGTEIVVGGSIEIDTDAPDVTSLAVLPATPIKNDPDAPATVTVTLTLTEPVPADEPPQLSYQLTVSHPSAEALPLAKTSDTTWTGGFILPDDAGLQAEALVFTYLGLDELGNQSTKISGASSFEVYQGTLPPLEPPYGLVGKSLPDGEISLIWAEVAGAATYQIWRKTPTEAELTLHTTSASTSTVEDPGDDGIYQYAVASVRQANGQESVSGLSNVVNVTSDGTAPGAPLNLTAQLVGNGILLAFDPPTPLNEAVTFSIYRSASDEITSLDGLVPLATGLAVLQAVDPTPSDTEHAYAIAAVDASGNTSPPSNTAYLNPGLLPVSSLKVEHVLGADPVVSWTHPNALIAGYLLTVNGADPVGGTLTETSYTDLGFAGDTRSYSVIAVDALEFESVPRTLTLPVITTTLGSGETLQRGLIDTLAFDVTATTDVAGARLLVKVGGITHQSATVDLAAGLASSVPVVIGGYTNLEDTTTATVTVEQTPNPGEQVRIIGSSDIAVTDDTYAVDLLNGKFTRGGTGDVQLVFHNTSIQEIELITAKGSGSLPSDEISFQLTDTDGNVLSSAPLKQGTGEGVLALPNGTVVARMQANGSYTSAVTKLSVPLSAPDDVVVTLTVGKVHYKVGKPEHVEVPGPSATLAVTITDAPYDAKVTGVTPELSFGDQDIVVSGVTEDTETEAPVAGAKVTIVIAVGGFERTFDVFCDEAGAFTYTFSPLANEGGQYTVWANHPTVKDKSVDATFTISRVKVAPAGASLTMATSYGHTIPITAEALAGTNLTNLRVEAAGVLPTGLTVAGPAPKSLASGQKTTLPTVITGDNNAPASGTIVVKVLSDEHLWATIPVTYTLSAATPAISVSPPGLETGVARGDSVTEALTLSNKGTAKFTNLTVSLKDENKLGAAPSWLFLASTKSVGDLAVGDKAGVTFVAAPPDTVALSLTTPYTFYLRVESDGEIVTHVPIYVWVNDSGVGGHLFKVTDIYTATLDKDGQPIEGVAGAQVEMDKLFGTKLKQTLTSDSKGEALFESLPTGTYKYRVTKNGKKAGGGSVVIKPGVTGATEVFLSTELVTIEWEVTETTIEDKYIIVLNATFETDVPAAVVLAEPASVALPDMGKGEVFYGEYTLTNYGLITAETLAATLPSDTSDYKFELLVTPPTELAAKEQVTIPYRVTRLSPAIGADTGGGGCLGFSYPVVHCYGYKCANGTWTKDCTTMWYTYATGICTGGGYTPYTYTGGGGPGGGGGYSGPGGGQPVPGSPGCDPCDHPELSSAEKECCKANKSQDSGSAVDLIGGGYTDQVTDLQISVLGHDVTFDRWFEGNTWRLRFFGSDLTITKTGDALKSITLFNTVYSKADEAGTVFSDGIGDKTITAKDDGTYRWANRVGDWRTFDDQGVLTALGDRNDRKVTLTRNAGGALVGLKDSDDTPFATYTWTGAKVTKITAADGRSVAFGWTGANLTSVTDVLGRTTTYTYDGQGRMTSKTFPTGKERHITYASNNVIASVLDQNGQGMYFDYGYNSTTQQNYSSTIFTSGKVHERWYDKNGALVKESIDGKEIAKLDAQGDLVVNADGAVIGSIGPKGETGRTYAYGPFDQLKSYTDERGVTWTWEYDAKGNITKQTIDPGGADEQVTTYALDAWGQVTTRTEVGTGGDASLVSTATYDAAGNVATVTNAAGHTTTLTYNTQRRALTAMNDDGDVLAFTYDAAGRITKRTLTPSGGAEKTLEERAYAVAKDAAGVPIGEKTTVTDAAGKTSTIVRDTDGRITAITDHWGRTRSRSYDADGQLVAETNEQGVVRTFAYETTALGGSQVTEALDGVTVSVTVRDAYGRLVTRTEGGVETAWFYDGAGRDPVQVKRPGLTELISYSAFGDPTQIKYLPDGGSQLVETRTLAGRLLVGFDDALDGGYVRELNASGRVTSRTDAAGHTESFTYDAQGRRKTLTDGRSNLVLALERDGIGNVTKRSFGDGQSLSYSFDLQNRLTQTTSSSGDTVTYTWDAEDRLTKIAATGGLTVDAGYDSYGRVTSTVTPGHSWTRTYDDFARTESTTVDFGPFAKTTVRTRDAEGRTSALAMPGGTTYDVAWGSDGKVETLTVPGEGDVSFVTLPPYGRQVAFPGGNVATWTVTALGVIDQITAVASGGATIMDYDYASTAYRITDIKTEHGDYSYTYDPSGWMVGATYPTLPALAVTWDASGNRKTDSAFGTDAWTVDAGNRLTAIGDDLEFTYDADGNLTGRTGTTPLTFTYDALNQLSEVKNGDGDVVATYAYDGFGRRVKKTVGGVTTYALWGAEGILAEYDASGTAIRTYGYRPETRLMAAPIFLKVGAQYYWYLTDHQGAPQKLVNGAGAVVWTAEVAAFGQAKVTATVQNPIRGSGQYFDGETGLHYNLHRYYDPALGRYLGRDKLFEHTNRTNIYQFADNDPMRFVDRTGLGMSAGINVDNDGGVTGGVGGSVGGYSGLGGEVSGGVEVSNKDCCKKTPGQKAKVIKRGQTCITVKVGVEGGVGVGVEGPVGGSAKLGTVGAERSCSLCNKCGETTPEAKCCTKVCIKGPSVGGNILIFKGEISLGELCYEACVGTDGFTHGPANQGPGWKVGVGGDPSGGGSSGGSSGGGDG